MCIVWGVYTPKWRITFVEIHGFTIRESSELRSKNPPGTLSSIYCTSTATCQRPSSRCIVLLPAFRRRSQTQLVFVSLERLEQYNSNSMYLDVRRTVDQRVSSDVRADLARRRVLPLIRPTHPTRPIRPTLQLAGIHRTRWVSAPNPSRTWQFISGPVACKKGDAY